MKIKRLYSFIIVFFLFENCCTKKACFGINDIREIELINFIAKEVDSISIKRYQKDTDILIDSIFTSAWVSTDKILYLNQQFDINLDYKIVIHSIDSTFLLNQFVATKVDCNTCFPPGLDKITVLESYAINGQKQISAFLQIKK